MLNTTLRLMDVNFIIKMGFFIGDLHRQLEQLHSEQFNEHPSGRTFTVYHGQGIAKLSCFFLKRVYIILIQVAKRVNEYRF